MTPLILALTAATVLMVMLLLGAITMMVFRHRERRPASSLHSSRSTLSSLLIRPAALSLERQEPAIKAEPSELARVSGLTLPQAEDLLDWLEQNGFEERAVENDADQLFAVIYRIDAEHARPTPHVASSQPAKRSPTS